MCCVGDRPYAKVQLEAYASVETDCRIFLRWFGLSIAFMLLYRIKTIRDSAAADTYLAKPGIGEALSIAVNKVSRPCRNKHHVFCGVLLAPGMIL